MNEENKPKSSYTKGQRIAAMIGVILLLVMYIVTLISALTTSPNTPALFKMCLGASVILPIIFWFYIRITKYFIDKSKDEARKE